MRQSSDDLQGPFHVRSAMERGLTRKMLRATRRWEAPFVGVRVPAGSPDELRTRCHALSTVLNDGVVFSHTTALRLLGVELPWTAADDTDLHVISRRQEDRVDRPGVVSHRSRQLFLDTAVVEGLPVTSPAQTFVHVATSLRLPDDVVVLGDAMMRRKLPLVTPAELTAIAERTFKVKGIAQVREQIERMRPGTDSSTETRARLALVAANLPCPRVNDVVLDPRGGYVKRVDLAYPKYRIAIEYDGDHHRTDRAQWQDDIRRRRALEALGWTVIVIVAQDLLDPTTFVSRVRQEIRAARRALWV
ncbi:endonuclease domain-containing protein [Isoptericola sp. NPDC057391]|uniref:endonuclease domain-containing protein n=1 Tax=Isoptericola sp. NPDC057391 TaxID=3346117 RepID=UPI003631E639